MLNLANKTVLVFDLSGWFTHVAERLAQDFGRVKYYTPWQAGLSLSKNFLPGLGLEDVERVSDFFTQIDQTDMCLFTNAGYGDLQEFLRRQNMPVFGSGAAEVLEIDRLKLKKALIRNDMATATSRVIKGVEALRKHLKAHENLYIKMSYFRGDCETFHHKEWFETETWLDNLALQLGPYGHESEFLVENPIEGDAVEVGYDTYAVNGRTPESTLWGYECKDAAFLGTTDALPERLDRNRKQLGKILEDYDYTGIFSTEVRVTPDEDFLIDFTARCPSPPSEVECALVENFSEIVWEGAHGKLIEPEFRARYGAMLVLKSEWIVEHPLALKLSNPDRQFIHGHFKIAGNDYAVVPDGFAEFGGAVGIGDRLEDAVSEAFEAAEGVSGYQVRFEREAFDDCISVIRRGEKLGLTWHSVPKQKAA